MNRGSKRSGGSERLAPPVPAVAASTADSVAGVPDPFRAVRPQQPQCTSGAENRPPGRVTRSDLDALQDRIADEVEPVELAELAFLLLHELETVRIREGTLRGAYTRLLAAARASVAAATRGEPSPLLYVAHELDRHGQLPPTGAEPARLLADAAGTATLARIASR